MEQMDQEEQYIYRAIGICQRGGAHKELLEERTEHIRAERIKRSYWRSEQSILELRGSKGAIGGANRAYICQTKRSK